MGLISNESAGNQIEENEIKFREMLNKLTKLEIVDYIHNYWVGLKTESENSLGKTDYMVDKFARIKMKIGRAHV